MDGLHIGGLNIMSVTLQSATVDALSIPIPQASPFDLLSDATVFGTGLGYSALDQLLAGTVQGLSLIHYDPDGRASISISGITNVSAKGMLQDGSTPTTTRACSAPCWPGTTSARAPSVPTSCTATTAPIP